MFRGEKYEELTQQHRHINGRYVLHVVFPDMVDQNVWPVTAILSTTVSPAGDHSKLELLLNNKAQVARLIENFMSTKPEDHGKASSDKTWHFQDQNWS
ncbi:hypothetical protein MCOR27_006956 [Pyricularia oryzae]|uniref:Helitron helicase-like domain-containing protein n=1 Tax=Pyricularia grisea TaxID=148305 RepID=A0ABQ8N444_PYRGI|nr:hypothetical protein MCOR01_009513 [Pyricularia oryzae]KAI6290819.1 hypothetical protein MCOR33_011029 [Pyricularia grisea]KAH9437222.1 hypothetical protein MCOR02_000878 [Pyricularia oryzae]KAI6258850.1 hypothetical protein MCOR19_004780 [Pyricularia oryzae]KAI6275433.1 hypothetical protein MCOR27_006956 [Pyricularia oryzae]